MNTSFAEILMGSSPSKELESRRPSRRLSPCRRRRVVAMNKSTREPLLFSLLEKKLIVVVGHTGRMKITPASSIDDAGRATSSLSQDRGGHDSIDRLFSETSRCCLGAPKNLTGPAKLASSAIVVGDKYIALSVKDGIVLK